MKKWLLQTSTIGGLLGLSISGIKIAQAGADPLTIALGVLSLALTVVNDGKFLKGLVPVLFVGLMATSTACGGGIKDFADDHQAELGALKDCAINCGTDIALDALSCPLTGGSIKDLIDIEIAKGMAKDAGMCILTCMQNHASDIVVNICK